MSVLLKVRMSKIMRTPIKVGDVRTQRMPIVEPCVQLGP